MDDKNKNRVVITGMGIICPLGHSIAEMWDGILNCRSGMAETTIFDAATYPTKFCSEVKNYDLTKYTKNPELHSKGNRHSKFAIGAANEACRQAKIDVETDSPADGINRRRMGIYLGAGEGPVDSNIFFNSIVQGWDEATNTMDWAKWHAYSAGNMQANFELEQEPNMPAAHVSVYTGARGPVRSCLTACAASTQAIGEAFKILQNGQADVMIAGGAHSMIHPLGIMGFNRLTALSTRNDRPTTASRPFTESRDGFVIGEGAAIVILETLESAKKRGVQILAEVIGYGSTSDAFRVTDMHEEARGAVSAIEAALKDANLTNKDIDYVSTHGTSTSENDSIETLALKTVFKEETKNTPVSSIKSMMGHLIGAAGAAELISCVLAIRDGVLPPTINYNDPDPELDLDYVPNKPRKADVNIAMKESFGFGGQNNVVIIKRYED
ncbi:MAG: beta-ketoacyl-[acyl-carrier-protein] synthase II [Planctomycetes bacterium GWF2_42_9]|nr:MAG: beta-ketoacyl-[acyl-carrier-protein] synthase II [Planctomycetes bacterium GWF2_42_9]